MSKFTPGPWKTKKLMHCNAIETETGSRIASIPDVCEHDGKPCGSIISQNKTPEELQANARLIAAAPELLEVLRSALEAMESEPVQCGGDWIIGMFCGLEDRDITDRYDACRYGYEKALEKVQEWVVGSFEAAIAKATE